MPEFAPVMSLSALDGSNGFEIGGRAAYDYAGMSVASVGNVNGDGFDDLVIGSPQADPNGDRSGAAYVVLGAAGGFPADVATASTISSSAPRISILARAIMARASSCSVMTAASRPISTS